MPKYDATLKALKAGVQSMTIKAAVKNIEGWETELEKVEVSGIKTLLKDLGSLKTQLQKEEIDGDAVRKLMAKLGKETVTISGRVDGKDAGRIKEIGEALTAGADGGEADAKKG